MCKTKIKERSCYHCSRKKGSKYYIFRVCVCSLMYPVRNAYAPYYIVISGVFGSTVFFPHYLINDTIFERKKLTEHKMCALIFSTNFI